MITISLAPFFIAVSIASSESVKSFSAGTTVISALGKFFFMVSNFDESKSPTIISGVSPKIFALSAPTSAAMQRSSALGCSVILFG